MTGSTPLPVFQGSVQTRIIECPSNHKRNHMHVLFWWVSTNICANIFGICGLSMECILHAIHQYLWVEVLSGMMLGEILSWKSILINMIYILYVHGFWLKTRYTKISAVDHHVAFYPLIKCQFWIILGMNLPVPIAYFVYTPRKRHPLMTSGAFSKCRLLAKAACRNVGLHSGMFVDLVSPSYIYSPANGGL
jgi:hypothetical protein